MTVSELAVSKTLAVMNVSKATDKTHCVTRLPGVYGCLVPVEFAECMSRESGSCAAPASSNGPKDVQR